MCLNYTLNKLSVVALPRECPYVGTHKFMINIIILYKTVFDKIFDKTTKTKYIRIFVQSGFLFYLKGQLSI